MASQGWQAAGAAALRLGGRAWPAAAARHRRAGPPAARAASPGWLGELVMLGIESSCDDTAAAVVTGDGRVLGEAIAGQADVHAAYGGVHPAAASRAHAAAIDRVVAEALAAAALAPSDLSAVAVTVGPGLGLCLDVGVRKARALSRGAALPLVPVHHMEAHALVARLPAARMAAAATTAAAGASGGAAPGPGSALQQSAGGVAVGLAGACAPAFPFLCLLVSGGHNLLVLARGVGDYLELGGALDDALGAAARGVRGAVRCGAGCGRRGPNVALSRSTPTLHTCFGALANTHTDARAHTLMHTLTHMHTHTHARTHARARARKHTYASQNRHGKAHTHSGKQNAWFALPRACPQARRTTRLRGCWGSSSSPTAAPSSRRSRAAVTRHALRCQCQCGGGPTATSLLRA
jgi:hypothetical protein